MQAGKLTSVLNYLVPGILISAVFTAIIGLTAANLSGFQFGRCSPSGLAQ
jgi:hypothetical protein